MQDLLINIFGEGKELETSQICARMFAMFFIALLLLRLGGLRIFGKKSSFDEIIIIMFGAILSRGVTGAISFGSAVAAGTVMIVLHRIVAMLCIWSKKIAFLIEGKPVVLFRNGTILEKNLTKCSLSKDDFMESLRLVTNKETLDKVETAYMENNVSISFILKEKEDN
jgi:uncharacterized membrane protein YcaP (DUF421 family)